MKTVFKFQSQRYVNYKWNAQCLAMTYCCINVLLDC